jgi:hypothetical protein
MLHLMANLRYAPRATIKLLLILEGLLSGHLSGNLAGSFLLSSACVREFALERFDA